MQESRRTFFKHAGTGVAGALVWFNPSGLLSPWHALSSTVDPIPPSAVNEFVKVAHSNLDRLKEIFSEYPHIINAAWDWGDGDFENAIGAAGHMGLRETAEFLLANGARADLFVLTMLGETAIVKATLERFPNLLNSLGPHGFTLLHHAKMGGEPAEVLYHFLQEKGLKELHVKIYNK
jgi:hypothetical protein